MVVRGSVTNASVSVTAVRGLEWTATGSVTAAAVSVTAVRGSVRGVAHAPAVQAAVPAGTFLHLAVVVAVTMVHDRDEAVEQRQRGSAGTVGHRVGSAAPGGAGQKAQAGGEESRERTHGRRTLSRIAQMSGTQPTERGDAAGVTEAQRLPRKPAGTATEPRGRTDTIDVTRRRVGCDR